ncbi:MAG: hypothetical protein WCD56_16015 [Pseudolabrys sp.]
MPTTAVSLNADFRVIIGRIKRIRATHPNFMAAFYGAVGVLVAALLAEAFIRVRRRRAG